MTVFAAAAEAGTLSAAGRRLHMPLASVSRKVSDLEIHLGAKLFDRSSRRLRLTDAGQSYLAACMRVLDDVSEAERIVSGEYRAPKGDLVLTAPVVFGRLHVLPVVTDFLAGFADIDIRMVLADRILDIGGDHVDVAVRIGRLPDSGLVAIRLGEIRQVVCATPSYFEKRGALARPDDLVHHDCIDFSVLASGAGWTFSAGKALREIAVHRRLVVNTAEAAIDAARAGCGVTRVLSYQVADAVRAGALTIALADFEPQPLPVHLVYTGQRLLPQKLRAFLDFAGPRLKAALHQASAMVKIRS